MRHMSLGDLADLIVAWEAGEVSEGRLTEVTGLDRVTLRNLRQTAIDRGVLLAKPTPEERKAFGLSPATSDATSSAETTTDPER